MKSCCVIPCMVTVRRAAFSKWRCRDVTAPAPMRGDGQIQRAGVQQQARRACLLRGVGVEHVAEYRVAQRRQMHAQLVRAAGDGFELRRVQPKVRSTSSTRQRVRLAALCIHHTQRPALPVGGNRQGDGAPAFVIGRVIGLRQAGHHGLVAFVHAALGKDPLSALHGQAARHQHQARGGLVQSVHDECVAPKRLGAGAQAILFVRPAAGTQQAGGLSSTSRSSSACTQDRPEGASIVHAPADRRWRTVSATSLGLWISARAFGQRRLLDLGRDA